MARLTDLARPIALAATLVAAGCAPKPHASAGMTVATVAAGYRERILLPSGHVLTRDAPADSRITMLGVR